MIKIQYATISETGKRKNNEDAFRMVSMVNERRWLALVCDGMGGHANGEIASKTVADTIVDYWGNAVTIAHLGDSRCYLMRPDEGLLYQTKDHIRMEYGWEIIDRCFFSYRPEVCSPDVVQFELKAGDRIMLCSDGLYKSMTNKSLLANMMDEKSLDEILDAYRIRCDMQGDDNYTAVLIAVI